jgi:hypothetical protein
LLDIFVPLFALLTDLQEPFHCHVIQSCQSRMKHLVNFFYRSYN